MEGWKRRLGVEKGLDWKRDVWTIYGDRQTHIRCGKERLGCWKGRGRVKREVEDRRSERIEEREGGVCWENGNTAMKEV